MFEKVKNSNIQDTRVRNSEGEVSGPLRISNESQYS